MITRKDSVKWRHWTQLKIKHFHGNISTSLNKVVACVRKIDMAFMCIFFVIRKDFIIYKLKVKHI
jgi:hypothetical protein